jgi:DNA helicase-2/ATP-dependent DNA helicase PcrA
MDETMDDLNKLAQKILDEIVQIENPILLLAGPGMGKTYALAYKIKHLVCSKKVNPHEISVITFTNEAAINMRRRISSKEDQKIYVEQNLQPDVICTMHKLGNRIVKDNRSKLGLGSGFKVLSSGYLKKILMQDCAQIIGAKRKEADDVRYAMNIQSY